MKTVSVGISELKQNNGSNIHSSYDWENIFHSITDMITIHDKDYNIICANRAAEQYLKLPSSSTIPVKCFKYFHGTEGPPEGCPSCNCLKTGIPMNFEIFEPHLNRHIEIRALPRYDNKNQIIGIIHITRDITKKIKSEKKLRDSRRQLSNLTSHLLIMRERERENIAREIHDELGQSLMLMHMELSLLDKNLPGNDKSLRERTRSISNMLNMTIKTVQCISSDLRPKLLDELGLPSAIKWQARKFQDRTGINCNTAIHLESINLDRDCDTHIFRIFQETLTNVYRHAKATHIEVSLHKNNDRLIMKVKDNGRGITKAQIVDSRSLGLIGMRERVYYLQGKIEIYGKPDIGTTVLLSIPLKKSKANKQY